MIPLLPIDEARRRGAQLGIPDYFASTNVFRALLQNPTAAGALANLLNTLLNQNTVDARLRELLILRIGWRCASEYEFCVHVRVAREVGLSEEEILGVRDPARCAAYGEVERTVIAMTDELLDHAEVSPGTWAALERYFSTEQLVELILAVGNWRLFATFLKTAKVPLEQGLPGWPEGRRPA